MTAFDSDFSMCAFVFCVSVCWVYLCLNSQHQQDSCRLFVTTLLSLLQVPDELLIDRMVGRRSDPVTNEQHI